MKILYLYIIKKFLSTFLFILMIIMALAVVFDISERVDDFIGRDAPLKAIVFDYYLNFIFYYSNLFSGLILFIAVIFFTSKMAYNSEIIAILTGSVSFRKMLIPFFISATIITFISLFMNHWVIPNANRDRLAFEETYIKGEFYYSERNTHIAIPNDESVYFESYSTSNNMGFKFSLEKWNKNVLAYKLNASSFLWDSTKNVWTLQNYQERYIDSEKERLVVGNKKDTVLKITPKDFKRRSNIITAMNYKRLNEFIEEERLRGSDEITFFELEKHQRTSYPFSAYVFTLIGVVIASRKVRGGIGLHLAMGFGICFMYIFSIRTTMVAATNAGLNPIISVWIPNILFGIFGLILYARAQK